jgi:hypothetical protein
MQAEPVGDEVGAGGSPGGEVGHHAAPPLEAGSRFGAAVGAEDRDDGARPDGNDRVSTALADAARPFFVAAGKRVGGGALGGVRPHVELQQASRSNRSLNVGVGIALAEPPLEL